MKKLRAIVIIIGLFMATNGSACPFGMMGDGMGNTNNSKMGMMQGGCKMKMSMVRHQYVMKNGIDSRYKTKANPLKDNIENIKKGKVLYTNNCASCHGISGIGDGKAGKNLNPQPTNIARFSKMSIATDGYLYWTISEGGTPIGTAMPPFKNALKDEEKWEIILYLRQL